MPVHNNGQLPIVQRLTPTATAHLHYHPSMLDQITPVVLTYDEEPNIGRCLKRLTWAKTVVVVDSLSADRTEEIARSFPNVRFVQREFDTHANQWRWATRETGIETEWLLVLDADYMISDALVEELRGLQPSTSTNGYRARFVYAVFGKPLRASLYPPLVVLFRQGREEISQEGHTQVVRVAGGVSRLKHRIIHDDRKSLARWFQNQARYMTQEADRLLSTDPKGLNLADRVRKSWVIAPFAMPTYLLFVRGLILDGRAGLYYTFQRLIAESILSIALIERAIRPRRDAGNLE